MAEDGYDVAYLDDAAGNDETIYIVGTTKGNELEQVKNGRFIFDICNNEFLYQHRKEVAKEYINKAVAITCGSDALALMASQVLHDGKKTPIYTIPDCANFKPHECKTKSFSDGVVNLIWYGDAANFQFTNWREWIFEPFLKSSLDINITFFTNHKVLPEGWELYQNNIQLHVCAPFNMNFLRDEVLKQDAVLLPIDHNHPAVITKTANKLIDGLMLGKTVFASPQPSYLEFMEYAYVGTNFKKMIEGWAAAPSVGTTLTHQGQDYVATYFSPEAIASQWKQTIEVAYND